MSKKEHTHHAFRNLRRYLKTLDEIPRHFYNVSWLKGFWVQCVFGGEREKHVTVIIISLVILCIKVINNISF